jgi:hypothetical protein
VRKLLLVWILAWPLGLLAQEDSTSYQYYDEAAEEEVVVVNPESLNSINEYKNQKLTIRKFDDEKWKTIIGTTNLKRKKRNQKKLPQGVYPGIVAS